ncbi:MAG: transcriptional regulator [Candidatus Krumholzibacteria bacterium]|nr:transcriptional regulator [Candidatus Krumholzibacteria bacterium]MDP6668523.1 transcriptional regulator [Candidatus Krumholzibacteria bacterium]MDP6797803.1 transcriptional regulator [Candidatus Krumholzibacteria bacterium]MDP7021404.1 transcriptional regulator [Candidatus Krumholzibacteria bacterium]
MEFDEIITSPARLAILSALIRGEPRSFTSLKRETGLADGNLHVQTRKLEKAGYLEIRKEMRGRRSHTRFSLTERGGETLKLHVRKLQSLLAMGEGVTLPVLGGARKDDSQVWS